MKPKLSKKLPKKATQFEHFVSAVKEMKIEDGLIDFEKKFKKLVPPRKKHKTKKIYDIE